MMKHKNCCVIMKMKKYYILLICCNSENEAIAKIGGNKQMRNKKGITLIALVITVIVMLLIAGVAINAITTDGVPFGKMQEVANKYNNEAQKEAEAINNIIAMLGETGGNTGDVEGGDEPSDMPQVSVDTKAEEDSTIDGNEATYANPLIPKGFKPINTETAVWGETDAYKNGLVIQDATSDEQTVGSEFVWIPVPDYTKFQRYEGYYNASLQSELSSCKEAGAAEGQTGLTGTKLEAQQMYASVKKYGGFYIARYEAGISRNMPQSAPSSNTTDTYADGTYKPTSIKDTFVWNYIKWGGSSSNTASDGYQGDDTANGAVKVARAMYAGNSETTVTSTLCYGVQWDAVMAFIDPAYITSSCETTSFVRNSTGKGNYTGSLAKTGSSDAYYVNNISDLAGNVWEWTMEAYDSFGRVYRGGNFYVSNSLSPASIRGHNNLSNSGAYAGFRGAFYCSTES